jgi:hypothetical protein
MTPEAQCAFLDEVFCRGDEYCQYKLTTACYPLGEKFCGKDLILGSTKSDAVLDDVAQWVEKHTHRCQSLRIAVITKYALLDFLKELRQQEKGA